MKQEEKRKTVIVIVRMIVVLLIGNLASFYYAIYNNSENFYSTRISLEFAKFMYFFVLTPVSVASIALGAIALIKIRFENEG